MKLRFAFAFWLLHCTFIAEPVLGADSAEPAPPAVVVPGLEGAPDGGFRAPWHTHQGFVPILGLRQTAPHLALRWRSAPLPSPLPARTVTFAWTGALGMGTSDGGNFTVSVNGRAAADFDVVVEPTRFLPRATGVDLVYDAVWVYSNSLDSSGHFYLTVPADWLEPGQPARLEVTARNVGSGRWFGLLEKQDAPPSVPTKPCASFVRRPHPALPPPAGEEAGYEWYLRQYRDPGILTTIGPPADPAEVAVSATGQLIDANQYCQGRGPFPGTRPPLVRQGLAFAILEGDRIQLPGSAGPVKQSLLDGFLPIVVTEWPCGDLRVRETAYAQPLEGETYPTGLESTLAWAGFEVQNTGGAPCELCFVAFDTADEQEPMPRLEFRDGAVLDDGSALFATLAAADVRVEFLPVIPRQAQPASVTEALDLFRSHRAVFNALVAHAAIKPGETARFAFNRVFHFPGAIHWGPGPRRPVAPEQLTRRSFEEGLRGMRARWQGLARQVARLETPDPALNRIYRKAMLDGYFLTKSWQGRSIVFDSVSYRCQWDDASTKWFYALDLLGDHATAARLLDTVFERQGQRKPAGTRTREGCFSDVTNVTGDGSVASWASCNGWALWAMAEHARLAGDAAWLTAHADQIVQGCDWIFRERGFSRETPDNPCTGLLYGKFVCDLPDQAQVSGVGYFAYTDAINHLGLSSMDKLFAERKLPDGQRLLQQTEQYRREIIASVDRLTDRSCDPWYVPWMLHAPRHQDRYFYDACGPVNLAFGGVLPRDDERIGHVLRWIIDRTHHGRLESAAAGVDGPTQGAMFYSQDLAVTLLELGRVEEFLRLFYTLLAANVSHQTLTTCEWMGNTQPHIHSISSLIRMLRTMLVQERDGGLYLLQGTPRRWLESGQEIRLRDVPTWYGPLSLHLRSRAADGEVVVRLNMPSRLAATPVRLRLRLPPGLGPVSANCADRPLPVDGEWVVLTGLTGEVDVRVTVQPGKP